MSILAKKFPPMPEILTERAAFARKQFEEGTVKPGNNRFPVVVDDETRVWLECQAYALNSSMASVAGMLLMSIAKQDIAPGPDGNPR